jgi:anaerobic carbon-monoxide dehydrogenase iron sulfur subunit
MNRRIVLDHTLCTNCRLCSVVCSVKKERVSDPSQARVQVVADEMAGVFLPVFCRHCEDPPCAEVCPVEAISRDEASGLVVLNEKECIGCEECVSACPYGGATWHAQNEKVLRCDQCDGDPECVKFCFSQALTFQACVPEYEKQARAASAEMLTKMLETVGP